MKWSKEEEDVLRRLWCRNDINRFDIAKILINHTPSGIAKHASDLNLKKEYDCKIDIEKLGEIELIEI